MAACCASGRPPTTRSRGLRRRPGSGTIIDHYNKALVGTDLKDLLGIDMFEVPEEGNWVTTEDVRVWVAGYEGMTFGSDWRNDGSAN